MRTLNTSQLKSFMVGTSLILTLAACGGSGGSSPAKPQNPGAQGVFTCQSAIDKKQQLQSGSIDKASVKASPFFGKLFSSDLLEVMFTLSPKETWEYAQNELNVPVYKVTLNQNQFRTPANMEVLGREVFSPQQSTMFVPLEEAPGAYRNQWMQASGGGGSGSLAGLYIHRENSSRPREIIEPVIMVRHDVDRWTLVHEIMHHVFNAGRRSDPNYRLNMMLRRDLQNIGQEINTLQREFNENKTDAKLLDITKKADKSLDIVKELAVRSNLEEVSIEGTLIECSAEGKLQDFNRGNINSAKWYIEYSARSAIQQYKELQETFTKIEGLANEMGFIESANAATAAFNRVQNMIDEVKNLETSIKEKAGIANTNGQSSFVVVEAMARIVAPEKVRHLHHHMNEWKAEYDQLIDSLDAL